MEYRLTIDVSNEGTGTARAGALPHDVDLTVRIFHGGELCAVVGVFKVYPFVPVQFVSLFKQCFVAGLNDGGAVMALALGNAEVVEALLAVGGDDQRQVGAVVIFVEVLVAWALGVADAGVAFAAFAVAGTFHLVK